LIDLLATISGVLKVSLQQSIESLMLVSRFSFHVTRDTLGETNFKRLYVLGIERYVSILRVDNEDWLLMVDLTRDPDHSILVLQDDLQDSNIFRSAIRKVRLENAISSFSCLNLLAQCDLSSQVFLGVTRRW
jgi:hypothetical protein